MNALVLIAAIVLGLRTPVTVKAPLAGQMEPRQLHRVFPDLNGELAELRVRKERYTVASCQGDCLADLELTAPDAPPPSDEEMARLVEGDAFRKTREMLDQPIISMLPMALGPFFVGSRFDKRWEKAKVRRLPTTLSIREAYVPGLPTKTFSSDDEERKIYVSSLVRVWQRAVYGGESIPSETVHALCDRFSGAMDPPPAAASGEHAEGARA